MLIRVVSCSSEILSSTLYKRVNECVIKNSKEKQNYFTCNKFEYIFFFPFNNKIIVYPENRTYCITFVQVTFAWIYSR